MGWAGIGGCLPEAPSPQGGAAAVLDPTSSVSQQQAASCHSHPFLTTRLPSPPASASRQVWKPRAVETSWVSRHQCLAPVPTWARHQCPVGERKAVPSQARGPSLNPPGSLCPSTHPPILDQPGHHHVYPSVPISGARVRERHYGRGEDGSQGEGEGGRQGSGVLQTGV